jgi:SulP family sulfate permease
VLEVDDSGKEHMVPVSTHSQVIPGLVIYRFNHSLYYANAELFSQEVLDLVNTADPPLTWFCLVATAIDDIDFSAAATLKETFELLKEKGVRLVLVDADDHIRRELDLSELTELFGKEAFYETVEDVETAFRAAAAND